MKDKNELKPLRRGARITAGVRKRGNDYVLVQIQLRGNQ